MCQYPYVAPIGSEIEVGIARDAVGGGHRGEYGDMLVEASGRCDWGLCCRLGGQQHTEVCLLYGDKSMNKGLISEDRGNKATLLLTIPCSLLSRLQRIYRSQYLD